MLGTTIDAAYDRVDRLQDQLKTREQVFELIYATYRTLADSAEADDSPLVARLAATLFEMSTDAMNAMTDTQMKLAEAMEHLEHVEQMQQAEDERENAALEREFNLDRYASVRGV